MFDNSANMLTYPKGVGEGCIQIDMSRVAYAVKRLPDIAITNAIKAPELIALFTEATLTLSRYQAQANYELERAITNSKRIRSRILLDEVPDEMSRRGLSSSRSPSGSEDQRSAVIEINPDYQKAIDTVAEIRAAAAFIEGTHSSMEKGYFAASKATTNTSHLRNNPILDNGYEQQ